MLQSNVTDQPTAPRGRNQNTDSHLTAILPLKQSNKLSIARKGDYRSRKDIKN